MPSTRTAPSAPPSRPAASPLTLPAGTCTWMRLPPGAVLRVAEGQIALQAGPAMCGQVLLAQPPVQRLAAGHGWSAPQPGEAAWLQLSSMGKDAAVLQVMEPPPADAARPLRALAGLLQRLRGGERTMAAERVVPRGA